MTNILSRIHEGMDVLDNSGHKIGTVETLKMTDEDPATAAVEQATPDEGLPHKPTIVDNFAEVFRDDKIPEPLRETLLRKGFIRIDAEGIFAADRYVLPEQIASVADDDVHLTVSKDDLIKRH